LSRPSSGQNNDNFDGVRTPDRLQKQELHNILIATAGSLFGNRLDVIGAAGYDLFKQYQNDIASVGANGNPTSIAYSAITANATTALRLFR
jgi:hypothetical protein